MLCSVKTTLCIEISVLTLIVLDSFFPPKQDISLYNNKSRLYKITQMSLKVSLQDRKELAVLAKARGLVLRLVSLNVVVKNF